MTTKKDILTKITATPQENSSGAFVPEINSNQDVVGNMNSQFKYEQTVDKDNGLVKNAYLEKIAFRKFIREYPGRLAGDIKGATALQQFGLTAGAIVGAAKLKGSYDTAKGREQSSSLEKQHVKALNGLNKVISVNTLAPSPIAVQRPKGVN